ncbi:hypothetical protein CDO73_10195 [Saccharibacillus sp. O23]|uniref:hypothetical protein n=1 Tax=Saccharibacillus sp. O23 TaxID=2009338 RepID=UPI000B4E0434|nr:hypothetical protein [Saccharibacillus sp. O23]OWR30945.1 hypothetical protein CDO73_10195 [Saccharibacillus sp. O23]
MNRKIATGVLALALAAGGTSAVSHMYADSAADSTTTSGGAAKTAPTASGSAAATPAAPPKADSPGPLGRGPHGGPAAERADIASLLKLTEDQLRTRQEAGETLAAIATAQGVDKQSVIDLLVSKHETHLKEELSAGKITQAQYDERLAKDKERAQNEVERTFDASDKGPGKGLPGGPGPGIGPKEEREAIASLLKLTEDELRTRQEAGQTLAAIATAQGVSKQALIDALVSNHETRLKEELSAGKITQTQYNERAAEARERAEERIDRVSDLPPAPPEGAPRPDGSGPRVGPNADGKTPAPAASGTDASGK